MARSTAHPWIERVFVGLRTIGRIAFGTSTETSEGGPILAARSGVSTMSGVLAIVMFWMLGTPHSAQAASVDADQTLRNAVLSTLLTEEPGAARLGVRAIRILFPADESMTDYIAESLLQLTASEPPAPWVRTTLGHIIMLGQLKNPRYRKVLEIVRARSKNEDVRKRIDTALAEIGAGEAVAYEPGSIDLKLERASAAAWLASARKADRSKFADIKPKMGFDELINLVGAPDLISEWPIKGQKFVFHYRDLGVVLVTFEVSTAMHGTKPEPPRLAVQLSAHEVVPVREIYTGNDFARAQVLGSVSGRALVHYFHPLRNIAIDNLDLMKVLVQRIMQSSTTARRYDEVIFKRTLSAIRRSKDPRGMEWIREVAKIPGKDRTKKYAARIVEIEDKKAARRLAGGSDQDADGKDEDRDLEEEESEEEKEAAADDDDDN